MDLFQFKGTILLGVAPIAKRLEFIMRWMTGSKRYQVRLEGETMQFQMLATQKVSVVGSPVDINGNPSQATLSSVQYSSSDPTVFTVAPDPSVPNGAIITGVAAGTATLTETATATEPDGTTTEQIQGVATIVLTATQPPPPNPAASISFTFGTPS